MEHAAMTVGFEVTDEVFKSAASLVFNRPGTACTP
jgi:hypothetical protein